MSNEKDELSAAERAVLQKLGRKGGNRTAAIYGSEHMAKIGRKGGSSSPTKFKAGSARTREIAAEGGKNSGGNFANDRARASEAGRKGGAARAERLREAREAEKGKADS